MDIHLDNFYNIVYHLDFLFLINDHHEYLCIHQYIYIYYVLPEAEYGIGF